MICATPITYSSVSSLHCRKSYYLFRLDLQIQQLVDRQNKILELLSNKWGWFWIEIAWWCVIKCNTNSSRGTRTFIRKDWLVLENVNLVYCRKEYFKSSWLIKCVSHLLFIFYSAQTSSKTWQVSDRSAI